LIAAEINLPVLIGGGIRTPADVRNAYESGADVVIVGNATENSRDRMGELIVERDRFNT
jgi:putative glycerol-1-phosphate prenyltransferase